MGTEGLEHVFWIGGSTCAGKTTVADAVAERLGARVYHFDRREPFHIYRSIPEEQPEIIRFMGMTMDERWVLRTPEEMAKQTIASWTERFPMVLDDLRAMEGEGPIVAEGAGLFPRLVAPLLTDRTRAMWLVATPAFIEHVRRTRGRSVADADRISDRPRVFRNLVARDHLMAEHIHRQANELDLTAIEVNGEGMEQVLERVLQRAREVSLPGR